MRIPLSQEQTGSYHKHKTFNKVEYWVFIPDYIPLHENITPKITYREFQKFAMQKLLNDKVKYIEKLGPGYFKIQYR